jgi:phosphate starvation-inducible protein PhoH and related proteins
MAKKVNYQEAVDLKFIITAKTQEQKELLKSLSQNTITLITGPSGCGKTFLAVTYGLQQLFKNKYSKLVLTRPVVEAAGEKLGFLPGDMIDKINPYMMPIFDAMAQVMPEEAVSKLVQKNGNASPIRILPLAYMRGMTFRTSFIICDEMQNSTPDQVRMLLTRLGEGSKMVLCGDTRQTDIFGLNGLQDADSLLQGIEGIGHIALTEASIVRHPLVQKIEEKYDARVKAKLEAHKSTPNVV